jgi:radical SAM family uncharacterized protein/radical SAM-linked protein
MPRKLTDILPLVSKPSRYIGNEVNAIAKDPDKAGLRIALCFPDTYEIGISHLGLKVLYEALNRVDGLYAERAYAPWPDMEKALKEEGLGLGTVETGTPLCRMDVVGFTLQYELSYTNVLNMLALSGIPVRSTERGDADPLVIAGGPCAFNPEPLAMFIDAFVIGDAEEAVVELAHAVLRHKGSGGGRKSLLDAVSRIDGVYVPAHFEVLRGPDGAIVSIRNVAGGPDTVMKRTVDDLDPAVYPERPIVPYMNAVHNRVTLEVARGCVRGCRFCQAGYIYRPYRARSPERILALAERSVAASGYDELSLTSLSTGDYPGLTGLMRCLMDRFEDRRVSVSLPSLRVGTLTPQMCEQIKRVRKTGFTVAPEAGTARLRDVINKNVTEEALVETARTVFSEGWDLIKLYFMVGLPTETDDDLDGIIRLARMVLETGRGTGGRRKKVNVGVSAFVPKPHTPFQWMGQIPPSEITRRMARLSAVLDRRPFAMKTGQAGMSVLEAALARGGRELGPVVEYAWAHGARFDGWTEMFNFGLWRDAFERCGQDVEAAAAKEYALDDVLPWDHIHTGITKKFLVKELKRALSGRPTPDCRERCAGCGLKCSPEDASPSFPEPQTAAGRRPCKVSGPRARVRIVYTKLEPLSLISHSELMNLFFRAFSRAGLPVRFSEGFNPHPKVSFGPALAVGVESEAEVLDMELDYAIDLSTVVKDLNSALPDGIRIVEASVLSDGEPAAGVGVKCHTYHAVAPPGLDDRLAGLVDAFLDSASVFITRKGEKGERELDIRPMVTDVSVQDSGLVSFTICEHDGRFAKPHEVAQSVFGLSADEARAVRLRRVLMR